MVERIEEDEPASPGTIAQAVGDPLDGGASPELFKQSFSFPPELLELQDAVGPLDNPNQPIAPRFLPSSGFGTRTFQTVATANTPGEIVEVSTPTLLRVEPNLSSFAGTAEQLRGFASPQQSSPFGGSIYDGINAHGGFLLLPAPGRYYVLWETNDIAGAFLVSGVSCSMWDVSNPLMYDFIARRPGSQSAATSGAIITGAGDSIVLSLAQVLSLSAIDVINTDPLPQTLAWGEVAPVPGLAGGINLDPLTGNHDRIRFQGPTIPMASLHNHHVGAGGSLVVVEYIRTN